MNRETILSLIFLALLAGALYVFNPDSGFMDQSEQLGERSELRIDIKNRSLADPRQADLRAKVGETTILQITTDEDGRLALRGELRQIFNPVFKGALNTITVPTDRVGSYRIVFFPGAGPLNLGQDSESVTIGTLVIEK
jgi:hypothetical protein